MVPMKEKSLGLRGTAKRAWLELRGQVHVWGQVKLKRQTGAEIRLKTMNVCLCAKTNEKPFENFK